MSRKLIAATTIACMVSGLWISQVADAAPPHQVTTTQLQAEIRALNARIADLQSQLTTVSNEAITAGNTATSAESEIGFLSPGQNVASSLSSLETKVSCIENDVLDGYKPYC